MLPVGVRREFGKNNALAEGNIAALLEDGERLGRQGVMIGLSLGSTSFGSYRSVMELSDSILVGWKTQGAENDCRTFWGRNRK
jgi:hypothetical protein